jgi:MFS family permease
MDSLTRNRITIVLIANTLLRVAGSSGGILIAFYLASTAHINGLNDVAIIGALGVILNVAELIGAIPVGLATDRFSARSVLVAGALLGGLATLMYFLSQAVAIFFVARAIQGIVAVVGGPPLLSLITEATKDSPIARNRVVGFYELSLLSGIALGGLVGGTLWDRFGVVAFSLLSLFYLVIAALFWWGAQLPNRVQSEHPLEALRHALANPTLLKLAPAWLALNAVIGLWLTHIAFQLKGPQIEGQVLNGRFSATEVGYILLVYAILFASGVLGWTFMLGRVTRVQTMRISITALLGTCAGLYALNANAWPPAIEWLIVGITAISVLISSGFTPAALAYLASLADEGEGRGSTMGVYTLLLGLGNAIGAGLGGVLASSMGFNGLIVGTLGLVVLALLAVTQLPEHVGAPPVVAPDILPLPTDH